MNLLKSLLITLSLALILTNCSDTKPFLREGKHLKFGDLDERPTGNDVLTFYVLGDWGTGKSAQKAVAAELGKNLSFIPEGKIITPFAVELGDNIYEKGLHAGWGNPKAEEQLHRTFGNIYSGVKYEDRNIDFHIVPGNHDYDEHATNDDIEIGDVMLQETLAEKLYPNWKYYPIDTTQNSDTDDEANYNQLMAADIYSLTIPQKIISAGPADIFALDTQVMLQLYNGRKFDVLKLHWEKLQNLLDSSTAPWKMLAAHHPVKTHGRHGGYREAIWYIPPIILGTLYDKWFIKRFGDTKHPAYKLFKKDVIEFMKKNDVQFFMSGHEHNLQLLEIAENSFQLVSGSAGKLTPVAHKDDTFFSLEKHGFVRFDVTENELWLEFLAVDTEKGTHHSAGMFRLKKAF